MKKYLALVLMVLTLTSCTVVVKNETDDNVKKFSNKIDVEELDLELDKTRAVDVPKSEIYSLDNKKYGYGQGRLVNNENKPYGALDFNLNFSKYNACALTDDDKTIYLTFDQGYENGYTAKILDVLKEKNVKATFFVVGDYAKRNPDLVKRMIDEGHTVGNHSYKHKSMPSLSVEDCAEEIMTLHEYMKENFNYEMTLFRPPMGEFSERSLAVTQNCGYKTVMWSFAYEDWDTNKQPSKEFAYKRIIESAHSGAIYLLHSVSKTNTDILGDVIDTLLEKGYVFGELK